MCKGGPNGHNPVAPPVRQSVILDCGHVGSVRQAVIPVCGHLGPCARIPKALEFNEFGTQEVSFLLGNEVFRALQGHGFSLSLLSEPPKGHETAEAFILKIKVSR